MDKRINSGCRLHIFTLQKLHLKNGKLCVFFSQTTSSNNVGLIKEEILAKREVPQEVPSILYQVTNDLNKVLIDLAKIQKKTASASVKLDLHEPIEQVISY